jgi:hypothetical protein
MTDKTGKTGMAAGESDDPTALLESFEAAVGITKGSPVYLSADEKVSPSTGTDDAIGIATKTVLAAEPCPVLRRGRVKVVADGAISRGKAVCSAASGKVTLLADQAVNEGGAATYSVYYNRKLGTALETTTTDGDLLFIDVQKK